MSDTQHNPTYQEYVNAHPKQAELEMQHKKFRIAELMTQVESLENSNQVYINQLADKTREAALFREANADKAAQVQRLETALATALDRVRELEEINADLFTQMEAEVKRGSEAAGQAVFMEKSRNAFMTDASKYRKYWRAAMRAHRRLRKIAMHWRGVACRFA